MNNIRRIERTIRKEHKKLYYLIIVILGFLLFYQAYIAGTAIGKFAYYITH